MFSLQYKVYTISFCCLHGFPTLHASLSLGVGNDEEAERQWWQLDTLAQIQSHSLDIRQRDVIDHLHHLSVDGNVPEQKMQCKYIMKTAIATVMYTVVYTLA